MQTRFQLAFVNRFRLTGIRMKDRGNGLVSL